MGIIKSVTVVVSDGASSHYIGEITGSGKVVDRIEEKDLLINGDPYSFYCGYADNGEMLFKISALCPVEVIYSTINK